MSTGSKRKVSVAFLIVAAFLGGVFFVTSAGNLINPGALSGQDAQAASVDVATDLGEAFSEVAEVVNPAVVQIRATRLISQNQQTNPFSGSPFQDFFQMPDRGGNAQPFEQNGLGSGAFIRPDGYIVTNNHVIDQADELQVALYDGTVVQAEVVGTDAFSDLAVLKVEGDNYPFLGYGSIESVKVGQWALAFGSPLSADLGNTVTAGIISAIGRHNGGRNSISNYLQTDAAVNPGNSGGPLVNLEGEIIGINSAIATRTGGFQGISFAIPIDIVRNTIDQIVESGAVERGYLGISFGPVTPALARALDVPLSAARIATIQEDADGNQPAGDAGLQADDIIIAVDGHELSDNRELVSLISNKRPGDTIEITYNRGGDVGTATVELGRRPSEPTVAENAPTQPNPGSEVEPISPSGLGIELADSFASSADKGVQGALVTSIDRDSEAFRDANIRQGDVIIEVERQEIGSAGDFESAYGNVRDGDTFLVRIQRGNNTFLTALTKPA